MQKLIINPKHSNLLFCLLAILHIAAGFAVFLAVIPIVVKLICLVILMMSLFFNINKYIYLNGKTNIKYSEVKNNQWQLTLNNGEIVPATLQPSTFISQWLVILNFKTAENKRKTQLLTVDSISANVYRQLRLVLA